MSKNMDLQKLKSKKRYPHNLVRLTVTEIQIMERQFFDITDL